MLQTDWLNRLEELESSNRDQFEDISNGIEDHLQTVVCELGGLAIGGANVGCALEHLSIAAAMLQIFRTIAVDLAHEMRHAGAVSEDDRREAATYLREVLARMDDKKSWQDVVAACRLLGVKLPTSIETGLAEEAA